jgi:small basic protein
LMCAQSSVLACAVNHPQAYPVGNQMEDKPPTQSFSLWIPVVFLIVGLFIGLQFNLSIPEPYARYTAVGILAALDAVIGAIRAELNKSYDNRVFVSGFITNIVLAAGLTFLGDRLGVDLSIAALVAFGVRLFNNVAIIRRHFIQPQ